MTTKRNADPNRTIEPPDYSAMLKRMIKAMGRRVGEHDPESLRIFSELRQALDDAEHAAITSQLAAGFSYAEMGRALGVSKVAVHKRFHTRETKS